MFFVKRIVYQFPQLLLGIYKKIPIFIKWLYEFIFYEKCAYCHKRKKFVTEEMLMRTWDTVPICSDCKDTFHYADSRGEF